MKSDDMKALSGIRPNAATLAIGAGALALLIIALILILRPVEETPESYQVQLYPFLTEAGVEIGYRPAEPISDFTIPLDPARVDNLSITMNAEAVTMEARRDGIGFTGTEPFDLVSVVIDRSMSAPDKAYPLVQYGTEAAVIDISRFQPVDIDGNSVSAGLPATRFEWVGEAMVWQGENITMLFENGLPQAVQGMIGNSVAVLNDYYKTALGAELQVEPRLMLLYAGGEPGQVSIEGDTVPGQALIRFIGGGFQEVGEEARRRTLENIAHELAHLWQLERAGVESSPDWLHEGGAQAIGLESLFITEKYSEADYSTMLGRARRECASALREGPVDEAAARGSHAASYACGLMAWMALASQTEGSTVVATWREFATFAESRRDGQSADAFFAFAETRAGEGFGRSLRQFINADYSAATGAVIIDELFAGTL